MAMKIVLWGLGAVGIVLLLSGPAAAHRGPVEFHGMEATSASGELHITVDPGLGFVLTGPDGELGRGRLPVQPGGVLLGDRGVIVLIDLWGQSSSGTVVRLLDASGAPRGDKSVAELFDADVRASFMSTMAGTLWRGPLWIDNEADALILIGAHPQLGAGMPAGLGSLAIPGQDASGPPGLAVVSLLDGSLVDPWPALRNGLLARSRPLNRLIRIEGAKGVPPDLQARLFADPDGGLRGVAVELAVAAAPRDPEPLIDALADCGISGGLRTRAAAALLEDGDRVGEPTLRLALGQTKRAAFAGGKRGGICTTDLDGPGALAAAAPVATALLGSRAEAALVTLALADTEQRRIGAAAVVGALAASDATSPGAQQVFESVMTCTECPVSARGVAREALAAAAPERLGELLVWQAQLEQTRAGVAGVIDQLIALGPAADAGLRTLLDGDTSSAVAAVAARWVASPEPDKRAAVGARLLAPTESMTLHSILRALGDVPAWPDDLIAPVEALIASSDEEWTVKYSLDLLGLAGVPGREALLRHVETGARPAAAAYVANTHQGTTIDACLLGLQRPDLTEEQQIQMLGRIREIVKRAGMVEPGEENAKAIAALFAGAGDRPRYFILESLSRGGEQGQRALAELFLDPDRGAESERLIGALKDSFGYRPTVPAELERGRGRNEFTRDVAVWRDWAQALLGR